MKCKIGSMKWPGSSISCMVENVLGVRSCPVMASIQRNNPTSTVKANAVMTWRNIHTVCGIYSLVVEGLRGPEVASDWSRHVDMAVDRLKEACNDDEHCARQLSCSYITSPVHCHGREDIGPVESSVRGCDLVQTKKAPCF